MVKEHVSPTEISIALDAATKQTKTLNNPCIFFLLLYLPSIKDSFMNFTTVWMIMLDVQYQE